MTGRFVAAAAAALALVFAGTAVGASGRAAPAARIDAVLQAMASQEQFSGAVLVARGDRVLLERAYGRHGLPAGVDTRFRIGSITKTFTAVALLQLAAAGRIDLNTSICRSVPRCPRSWRPITPAMLLSHTAGLPDALDHEDWRSLGRVPLPALVERLRHVGLRSKPGTRWAYCNACYLVAGLIVQQVSGEGWFAYVEQHILDPADMRSTLPDDGSGRDRAMGYSQDRQARLEPAPFEALGRPDPAGGLLSTVGDLYRFTTALADGRLLPPRWQQRMLLPAPATKGAWGLGWELGARKGHRFARHSGSIEGWSAILDWYRDDGLTVVVLSNLSDGNVDFINHQLPAIVLGWPYDMPAAPRAVQLPAATYARLVGTYAATRGSLTLEVRLTSRGLVLYPGPSGGGDRLTPLSAREFADQHDPRWHASFTIQNGRAVAVRMRNLPRSYSFLARRTATHLSVPPPTGPLPVGTKTTMLVDRSRRDPFAAGDERRRILVQLYYPSKVRAAARAAYAPDAVRRAIAASADVPDSAFQSITTNAGADAAARPGKYPVLIFSPGYTVSHSLYTALLEDLASRGYVVIAVDHTRETEAVQFPDGQVVRRTLPNGRASLALSKPIEARDDDVLFTLRHLRTLTRRTKMLGADLATIGLLGHSLGGLTAADAATADPTVGCAADIDGSVYGDARRKPFRRPFLILKGAHNEATLARWWANLSGERYWVTVSTGGHLDFTDWSWIVPALRANGLAPQIDGLGHISAAHALSLERHYLSAFFDQCLKHHPTSAFDDPAPEAGVTIRR